MWAGGEGAANLQSSRGGERVKKIEDDEALGCGRENEIKKERKSRATRGYYKKKKFHCSLSRLMSLLWSRHFASVVVVPSPQHPLMPPIPWAEQLPYSCRFLMVL